MSEELLLLTCDKDPRDLLSLLDEDSHLRFVTIEEGEIAEACFERPKVETLVKALTEWLAGDSDG